MNYPLDWGWIAFNLKETTNWTCKVCGFKDGDEPNIAINVHHRDHDPSNCHHSNLLVCCQRCHLRIERRYRSENARWYRLSIDHAFAPRYMPGFSPEDIYILQMNSAGFQSP